MNQKCAYLTGEEKDDNSAKNKKQNKTQQQQQKLGPRITALHSGHIAIYSDQHKFFITILHYYYLPF